MKATARKHGDYFLPAIKMDDGRTIVHRLFDWFQGNVTREAALHGSMLDIYAIQLTGDIPHRYRVD